MPKITENRESSGSLFLLPEGQKARAYSTYLDKLLGYRINRVENKLTQKYQKYDLSSSNPTQKKHFPGTEAWIGLRPEVLQTPYSDIYDALHFIKVIDSRIAIDTIVDVGAAYGRVAFIKEELFHESHFIGYEVVKGRQQEGERVFKLQNLNKSEIRFQNVLETNFSLPHAQVYFIYDFSDSSDISHIIESLMSKNEPFFMLANGERTLGLLKNKFGKIKRLKKAKLSVFYYAPSQEDSV